MSLQLLGRCVHTSFFYIFFEGIFFSYYIQHCFICRPSDSTVSTDAGIEHRTVATDALAVTTRLDLILHTSEGGWGFLVVAPVGGGEEGVAGAYGAVTSRQQAGVRPARPVPPTPSIKGQRTYNRARIFNCLWGPGIDSNEWIPPAYVAWRAGTITLFLPGS